MMAFCVPLKFESDSCLSCVGGTSDVVAAIHDQPVRHCSRVAVATVQESRAVDVQTGLDGDGLHQLLPAAPQKWQAAAERYCSAPIHQSWTHQQSCSAYGQIRLRPSRSHNFHCQTKSSCSVCSVATLLPFCNSLN